MNLKTIIFLLFTFTYINLYSQEMQQYFVIEKENKSKNDTKLFKEVLLKNDKIKIKKGKYFIEVNQININGNIELIGEGDVEIIGLNNCSFKSLNPASIFSINNPESVNISNITFVGSDNNSIAIKITNDNFDIERSSLIEIKNNNAQEIGLIWIGPKKGFTYNRIYGEDSNWFSKGPIKENNWQSKINVFGNICQGNKNFYSGNFEKPSASAITLLYSNNINVNNNKISNYRFGIWTYGGASRTVEKEISKNPILSSNICVYDNEVTETFSPIWFSKSTQIEVYNNSSFNNQDVAIDFEGCENGLVYNNIVNNSRGGALTALNGSNNILFKNNEVNLINYNKQNNIILIRDGNSNISYVENNFRFIDDRVFGKKHSRVLFNKSSEKVLKNSKILFKNNTFENVIFDIKDGSGVHIEGNKFLMDFNKNENFIKDKKENMILKNNTIN